MRIYIIRHGETKANVEGRFQGQWDVPLNEWGRELASITGKAMSGLKFDAAYSSPLSRAFETAELVLKELGCKAPIIVDDRLAEADMGVYSGVVFRNNPDKKIAEAAEQFLINPMVMGTFPEGESIADVMERTQSFLHDLACYDYENVLVSTHGCATRCMLHFLYEDQDDFWQGNVPYNCAVNILNYENGEFSFIEKDKLFYDKNLLVDRFK